MRAAVGVLTPWHSRLFLRDAKGAPVARGWGRCGQVTVKGYKVSSWSDENVLELMFVTTIHNFMDMLKKN